MPFLYTMSKIEVVRPDLDIRTIVEHIKTLQGCGGARSGSPEIPDLGVSPLEPPGRRE